VCKFSLDFMSASLYYVYRKRHAVVVFKFKCLVLIVYDNYLPIRLPHNLKCVTSGDVGRGVAEYDPHTIWNPRKTADLS